MDHGGTTAIGIFVLSMIWDGDVIVAVGVFVPWCKMIFSKAGGGEN